MYNIVNHLSRQSLAVLLVLLTSCTPPGRAQGINDSPNNAGSSTNQGVATGTIQWTHPTLTSNLSIVTLLADQSPGVIFPIGGDGNKASVCLFDVTITADCSVTYSAPLLSSNCASGSKVADGTRCMFTCAPGKALVGSTSIICNVGTLSDTLPTCEDIPPFVNLTIIVVDHTDSVEEAPAPDTEVSVFIADESAEFGTAKFASAFTGPDGIAVIPVPHNQTIIVTGSREGNLVNSQTFKASWNQRNVMILPLAAFEELNLFLWRRISFNGFEFGDKQEGHSYRVEIPAGGLAVPERRRVTIEFYGVNVSIPQSLEHAPEAIAAIPRVSGMPGELTNGESGTDLVPLEMVGVMELKVYRTDNFQPPWIKSLVKLTLPVQKLPAGLGVGDLLDAWYFDPDHGVWRNNGTGVIQKDRKSGEIVWVYHASHFTWWAAGRPQAQPSCVRVRTCFDDDCIQPAPTVRVRLIGDDYGFVSSRTTDSKGEACFTFKHTGTVTLEAVCARTRRDVVSTTLPSVFEESDTDIPRRTLDLSHDVDSCQNVTLVLPLLAGNMACPNPGDVMFSTSRIETGDAYGDTVQYTCPNGLLPDPYEGYRACLECGQWSGRPVSCADGSSGSSIPF